MSACSEPFEKREFSGEGERRVDARVLSAKEQRGERGGDSERDARHGRILLGPDGCVDAVPIRGRRLRVELRAVSALRSATVWCVFRRPFLRLPLPVAKLGPKAA